MEELADISVFNSLGAEQRQEDRNNKWELYRARRSNLFPLPHGKSWDFPEYNVVTGVWDRKEPPYIYDRGNGLNVPLLTLVKYAKSRLAKNRSLTAAFLRRARIKDLIQKGQTYEDSSTHEVPVDNIRIYPENIKKGKFNLRFYGEVLPALVSYIHKNCQLQNGEVMRIPDIYALIDSPDHYVGRSESVILQNLGKLAQNISQEALASVKKPVEENAMIDNLFKTSNPRSVNRQTSRQYGIKYVGDLLRQGLNKDDVRNVISSFDIFGVLCDLYKVSALPILNNLMVHLYRLDDRGNPNQYKGIYRPEQHALYVCKDAASPPNVAHELYHALLTFIEGRKRLYTKIPRGPRSPDEKRLIQGRIPGTCLDLPDNLRKRRSSNPYASLMHITIDKNGRPFYGGEYLETLLSKYLANEPIPKEWQEDFIRSLPK